MLLTVESMQQLDGPGLMKIYREGNEENAAVLYPEMDRAQAVYRVEQDFLTMLGERFFGHDGNRYLIWSEDSAWVSALRLYFVRPGLYYIEALETDPSHRRQGYASRLLKETVNLLKEQGSFRLCDCVSRRNEASLAVHLACGFTAVDPGFDYLEDRPEPRCLGMEFRWEGSDDPVD